jgi:hypothetical protein
MKRNAVLAFGLALLVVGPAHVSAHQSELVGNDKYRVIVGFVQEPIFTDQRNGLDLIIRPAESRDAIPGLEDGLHAELIAPDGETRREFPIRPQYGSPGRYTFDVVLSEPGQYRVRVWGDIKGESFDETFSLDEVRPISDIRFPGDEN